MVATPTTTAVTTCRMNVEERRTFQCRATAIRTQRLRGVGQGVREVSRPVAETPHAGVRNPAVGQHRPGHDEIHPIGW